MSERSHKVMIGGFVLGALSLMLGAIAVIGSGTLFSSPEPIVFFFNSSIKGLTQGSPVTFRGVPVGRVTHIGMVGDLDSMEFRIPVEVEINDKAFPAKDVEARAAHDTVEYFQKTIAHGLRGRLNTQSLLTGQLLIELDFFAQPLPPDAPLPEVEIYKDFIVIPTVPSQLDTIWQRVAQLPIDELARSLVSISERIDTLLATDGMRKIPQSVDAAIVDARDTLHSIRNAADGIHALSLRMSKLTDTLQDQTPETIVKTKALLDSYTQLAANLEQSLTGVRGVVGPNTVTIIELNRAVREITETARAIRSLANVLERNPESLLLGKGEDRR